jgi:hypothetical protein
MAKNVLTHNLSEALGSVKTADVNIDPGDGNLSVDGLTRNEQELASGTLQYLEKNGLPNWSVDTSNQPTTFTIKAARKGQPWLRLPWATCNGATNWQIHLNRRVPSTINAHSDGGNIRLDLNGMPVIRVSADTGGGNIEVVLPDTVDALSVTAKSGAGNVVVQVPSGIAARIHATTGLGKLMVSPRFIKIENDLYQSPNYDQAERKIEMTISSGAGNVVVEERITS